jgi:hypothetical protein
MITDNELLDEVRAVLYEEVADVTAGPAIIAAVRRKQARRARVRRLGIAVTAAAAAAAIAFVVVSPTDRTAVPDKADTPGQTDQTAGPAPANAAYVVERTSAALGGVLGSVVYERSIITSGDKYSKPGEKALYERWMAADGSTFRLRVTIDGKPVVDLSRDRKADVFVDYRTRTFHSSSGVEPSAPEFDDVLTPKEIRQALADGTITVVGPGEQIGGRPTVRLHQEARKADAPLDLWVDAKTYLPVRRQWQQEDSTPFDVAWLPSTPENLAKLTTTVPPGFDEE